MGDTLIRVGRMSISWTQHGKYIKDFIKRKGYPRVMINPIQEYNNLKFNKKKKNLPRKQM